MALFSERYNYVKPSDVLQRENFPKEIANAVCNCYDVLEEQLRFEFCDNLGFSHVENFLWEYFLNNRRKEFYGQYPVATGYLENESNPWYRKLDMIEITVKYLSNQVINRQISKDVVNYFVTSLNASFRRLNYAYRIIGQEVIEVTSAEEETAIETALNEAKDNIKEHLESALSLYAKKPSGDYRNSIKESISAVEAYCREKTGEKTLGKALKKLKSSGIIIPNMLEKAFEDLYTYTNQPDTGIRHALMVEEGKYTPGQEEALFMLVSCSSFINYLRKKYNLYLNADV